MVYLKASFRESDLSLLPRNGMRVWISTLVATLMALILGEDSVLDHNNIYVKDYDSV